MIGKIISHFKIIEKLGSGGMGIVYEATDTKLDRTVALKFLPPHLHLDKESEKRFVSEAKAASSFDHPTMRTPDYGMKYRFLYWIKIIMRHSPN